VRAASDGLASAHVLAPQDWLPARVPGHVHLDLMLAGVIQDPYYRLCERDAAWVDETDWVYETEFRVDSPAGAATYLVFHGLDTLAEITLNGEPLGRCDNMFVPYEFSVGDKLRVGDNKLQVVLRAATRAGQERMEEWLSYGDSERASAAGRMGDRSFVRKAQYMYGWDWGPRLVSCGIWKPVELVTVPMARLLDWRHDVEFTPQGPALLHLQVFVERSPQAKDVPLSLRAALPEVGNAEDGFRETEVAPVSAPVPTGAGRLGVELDLRVDQPQRWEPVGRSDRLPTLYRPALSLVGSEIVDQLTATIGLRTIELVTEPDPDGKGESFKFRVNGEDLFAKGANWIPADSFPSRLPHDDRLPATDEALSSRIRDLLVAARQTGMNMLRVWGGGLYESDHFYNLCDQLGLLVWQDFAYACGLYPDEGEYAAAARAEAIAAVRRLRVHPSLVLWCGNNECQVIYHKVERLWGERLFDEVLPAVVAEEDPGRPYWPGSPWGGSWAGSQDAGDTHNWNVWHGTGDWTHYSEDRSRFVSEFGFSAACSLPCWDLCLAEEDKDPFSDAVKWHDRTLKAYETYIGYICLHFPRPKTLEDLVHYSQINQAEAMKFGAEHWRRLMGRCWGTLIWQLEDCWPAQSWALIDYALEPKAAYYWAQRYFAPVLLSLHRREATAEAHLINDLLTPVSGTVKLSLCTFEGKSLAQQEIKVEVGPNRAAAVGRLDLAAAANRERETYVYGEFVSSSAVPADGLTKTLFLAEPKELALADPGLEVAVERAGDCHFTVTLSAQRFAPYVWLRLDGPQATSPLTRWDDNFIQLHPGEMRKLRLERQSREETEDSIRSRLVIRHLCAGSRIECARR